MTLYLNLKPFFWGKPPTHEGKNFREIYYKEPGQSWYFVKNAIRSMKKKDCTTDFALGSGFVTLTAVKALRGCVRM